MSAGRHHRNIGNLELHRFYGRAHGGALMRSAVEPPVYLQVLAAYRVAEAGRGGHHTGGDDAEL